MRERARSLARGRPRAEPHDEEGDFTCPPPVISQLSFLPSGDASFFFFPHQKSELKEKPRARGIVSLEYIQITGGVSSPIRRGARNYFSGSIIPGYEFYPPFCWINLLAVYVSSLPSLPHDLSIPA